MTSAVADSNPTSRMVTARVARRAWLDPHVRTAWLAGLGLLIVGIGFLIQRTLVWRLGARLIEDGVPVEALIVEVNGSSLVGRSESGDRPLALNFVRDGKTYYYKVPYLDGRHPEEPLVVGQHLTLRVDSNDPTRWSPRRTPAPLGQELIGGGLVVGAGLLFCILAALLRVKVLKTFRTAPQIEVVVLAAKHAPIAPRAWQVRCSPVAEGDDRVFTVYAPAQSNIANATLRLLTPARGRALSLEWFE